ncbi:hypothetical protein [Anabaena sp. 4-3]|uniref:hypothetical protein n=1 Tax=Anabaena sp. 4-3 TaxID=1811979 RepID=UPI000B14C7D5|nr:hypothetical protein [Anabaena sp. 4-3]
MVVALKRIGMAVLLTASTLGMLPLSTSAQGSITKKTAVINPFRVSAVEVGNPHPKRSRRSFGRPSRGSFGRPSRGSFGRPSRGSFGRPSRGSFGRPSRGSFGSPRRTSPRPSVFSDRPSEEGVGIPGYGIEPRYRYRW